jgi:ABC-2 type transport system permease protein
MTWFPFWILFKREIARFFKVIVQTVFTPFVTASLYLMIFGVSLGENISLNNGLPYLAFLIPGLVMMGCLNNAFQNSSSSIITSRFSGDLEDLKASPLSPSQIIWALSLGGLVRGLIVGLVTLIVGEIAFHLVRGEFLGVAHPLELLVFLVLGGLAFANIGISVAFWAKSFDQMSAVSGFVLLPLIYLGGVFFSIEHLPEFWRQVAVFNPLLYVINGVRYGLIGWADVGMMHAFGVAFLGYLVTLLLAYRSVRRGGFQRW